MPAAKTTFSVNQLREATLSSRTWKEVALKLGYSEPVGGSVIDRLSKLADKEGIPTDTIRRRRTEWLDEDLRYAVSSSTTWDEVARGLGYSGRIGASSRTKIRRAAMRLGIDLVHLDSSPSGPSRKWSDDDLVAAVSASASWAAVARAVRCSYKNAQKRAAELELDVSHLNSANPLREPETKQVDLPWSSEALYIAAEDIARAWYTLHGGTVYTPPAGNPDVDLLVEREGRFYRSQVKSTTFLTKSGRWNVGLVRRNRNGSLAAYTEEVIDEFFIVTGAGDLYLIPLPAVAEKTQATLGAQYEKYRVQLFGSN